MFVWNIDPNLLHIGSRGIRYYGVIFALALMGGFYIWQWQMNRGGHSKAKSDRFLTLGVIGVIAGARLGHCFFYEPERYLKNPIDIIKFWEGGLASHGATIGLILALIYFSKTQAIRLPEVIDRFSMSAAWGAALVRLGNFMNSEIVGRVTDVGWKTKFPRHDQELLGPCNQCGQVARDVCDTIGERCYSLANVPWRHPSQLYEFGMGLLILLILYLVDRKLGEKRPLGLLGALFITLYFSGRLTVEFFKEYQNQDPSAFFTIGQYLSMPFIALGLWGLWWTFKHRQPTA